MKTETNEKSFNTTIMVKIGDRIRTPKGHLLIIKNIWVENFHLELITYIEYDFVAAGGHTGNEQKTIGAFQAFLHTESITKNKAKIEYPEEVKIDWVEDGPEDEEFETPSGNSFED